MHILFKAGRKIKNIYLVMQLLEEVDFILQGLHLPLQVQSGEGSIVHILHGHIDSQQGDL